MNKKKTDRFIISPKLRIFLVLLFLSSLYWFFTSLSENYIYETQFEVHYKNIPKDLLFQKAPIDKLTAQIEATGFELLSQKINAQSIVLDVSKFTPVKAYQYSFQINNEKLSIQKQIPDSKIIRFKEDSVFVFLGKLKTKKVPIVSKIEVSFQSGYKLRAPLKIIPDSILIKGPEKFVSKVQSIATNKKELNNLHDDFEIEIPLNLKEIKSHEIIIEQSHVKLIAKVAKFTEGELEIEIKSPVLSKGMQLELFPKKATLKYEVTFDKYQEVDLSSFEISFIAPKDNGSTKYLDLILTKKPDFITNYSIEPEQVKFLMQETKL